jgi:molecular chaperone HtpG
MSSLVTLEVKQPDWKKTSEEVFIGKDILELLSTSMYVEPLSMYREYVQNAADSLESCQSAIQKHTLQHDVEIHIDRQLRNIRITDRGLGLSSRDFYRRLTAIGGSAKRGTKARGFRGVGRLAGLAFCQELIFRTRAAGSDQIQELRWDTRKVRSLLRSSDATLNLAQIVSEAVDSRTVKASSEPKHFFEVELRNVVRHRDDRLLDSTAVAAYLEQVAPVPFHPEFKHGEAITSFLLENGVNLHPLSIQIDGDGQIYRPHRNVVSLGNGKSMEIGEPELFVVLDRNGDISAVSWILHHAYLGSLPKSTNVAGWRMRSGNIQVGGEALLEDLFPESRFNGWTIAETHVIDPKVIPNGRRDNYEHSAHLSDLLTRLTPFTRKIANLCRSNSIARNAHQRVETELLKLEERYQVASKPRTPAFVVTAFQIEFAAAQPELLKITSKSLFETAEGEGLRSRLRKLESRVKTLAEKNEPSDPLSDFPFKEREVLRQVIEAIHTIQGETQEADTLVGKVLARLRRQRSGKASKK